MEGFPGSVPPPPDGVLTVECDVLIPAALGRVIYAANWEAIAAPVIVEGANHPLSLCGAIIGSGPRVTGPRVPSTLPA